MSGLSHIFKRESIIAPFLHLRIKMATQKFKKQTTTSLQSFLYTLLYVIAFSLILYLMDKAYAWSNPYFIFEFTSKEFFNKLPILALVISIVPKKNIRIILYLLLITASFFQYIHFSYFGKNIGAIEFYLFKNNIHETLEVFATIWHIIMIPFMIVTIAFVALLVIDRYLAQNSLKYKHGLILLLVVLLGLNLQTYYMTNLKKGKLTQGQSKLLYPTTNRHSARNFFVSANYFLFGILPKKLFATTTQFPILKKPALIHRDVNRTIILVIGESLRFDTFTLNHNTLTPKLQSLKSDTNFFFKKVYSGGTMTKVSVSTLINRLKYPHGLPQIAQENNCLFKLAKENHFSTFFFSGQSRKHLQIIRDLICPKYIDQLIDRDSFATYITPTGYDEDLQRLLEKQDILKPKNFIVLQQRGSHSPYKKQYPKMYDKYTPYENTALHTDATLYQLINYVKTHIENEFFLFYVSDHGELLGEYGKKGHGHLVKEVYEVPFLMYTNSKNEALKAHFRYVRNHYDIANYILSLLGYKADLIKDEDRTIYILNADLDGFSGYGVIEINDSKASKIKIRHY